MYKKLFFVFFFVILNETYYMNESTLFTQDEINAILSQQFLAGYYKEYAQKKTLQQIIEEIIRYNIGEQDYMRQIRNVVLKKEIESWKQANNTKQEPDEKQLQEIFKQDFRGRLVNKILKLKNNNNEVLDKIWFKFDIDKNEYKIMSDTEEVQCILHIGNDENCTYLHDVPVVMTNINNNNIFNNVDISRNAENTELEKSKINDENIIDNSPQPQEKYYEYSFYSFNNNICGSRTDGNGCGCLGCNCG